MKPDDETTLKVEINNFLWMYAPGNLRLFQLDEIACAVLQLLVDADSPPPRKEADPRTFRVRDARLTEDVSKRGWCYSLHDHFEIHWDNGHHDMNVTDLSYRSIFKDGD